MEMKEERVSSREEGDRVSEGGEKGGKVGGKKER